MPVVVSTSCIASAGTALRAAMASTRSSCWSELDKEKVVEVSVTLAESPDVTAVENNVLPRLSLFAIVSQAQRSVKLRRQ